jgi:hypothetical protein
VNLTHIETLSTLIELNNCQIQIHYNPRQSQDRVEDSGQRAKERQGAVSMVLEAGLDDGGQITSPVEHEEPRFDSQRERLGPICHGQTCGTSPAGGRCGQEEDRDDAPGVTHTDS